MAFYKTSWMMMKGNNINIYASKLADCCNMNQYKSPKDLIKEYHSIKNKDNSYKSLEEKVEEKVKKFDSVEKIQFESIIKSDCKDAVEVQKKIKHVKENTDLCKDPEITRFIEKTLYTSQGNKEEDTIREKFAVENKREYSTKGGFVTSKIPIFITGNIKVNVGGRHDGMDQDGNLIEIKNRMNKFLGVMLYEKVQIHAYMFIFEKDEATLIENYMGEVREHVVQFDDDFWEEVKESLKKFIKAL